MEGGGRARTGEGGPERGGKPQLAGREREGKREDRREKRREGEDRRGEGRDCRTSEQIPPAHSRQKSDLSPH